MLKQKNQESELPEHLHQFWVPAALHLTLLFTKAQLTAGQQSNKQCQTCMALRPTFCVSSLFFFLGGEFFGSFMCLSERSAVWLVVQREVHRKGAWSALCNEYATTVSVGSKLCQFSSIFSMALPFRFLTPVSSLWRCCAIRLAIFCSIIFLLGTVKVEIKTILRTALIDGPSHTLKNTVLVCVCVCCVVCGMHMCVMWVYVWCVTYVHVRKRINVSAEHPCPGW